jgi:hypothetical protein
VISHDHSLASWFIILSAVLFAAVYAVPLTVAPLRWARWFRWQLSADRPELATYLGRCTGALSLTIIGFALRAVPHPEQHLEVFELIGWGCGAMTAVHVWGAIRRIQPWTEDAEIVLYGAACAVSFWIRQGLG